MRAYIVGCMCACIHHTGIINLSSRTYSFRLYIFLFCFYALIRYVFFVNIALIYNVVRVYLTYKIANNFTLATRSPAYPSCLNALRAVGIFASSLLFISLIFNSRLNKITCAAYITYTSNVPTYTHIYMHASENRHTSTTKLYAEVCHFAAIEKCTPAFFWSAHIPVVEYLSLILNRGNNKNEEKKKRRTNANSFPKEFIPATWN